MSPYLCGKKKQLATKAPKHKISQKKICAISCFRALVAKKALWLMYSSSRPLHTLIQLIQLFGQLGQPGVGIIAGTLIGTA